MFKKSWMSWIVLVLLASLLLVACGGGTADTPVEEDDTEADAGDEAMEDMEDMEDEEMEETEEPAPEDEPTPEPEGDDEEMAEPTVVKIGFITDLTGPLAIYGTMVNRGFFLGMEYATGSDGGEDGMTFYDEANNIEYQIVVGDDQSNPETSATLAREMIESDEVDILVGSVSSGVTASLQEIARENEIPLMISPAASASLSGETFNEYSFRVSRHNYQDSMAMCSYLVQNYKTFVQIAADYNFGWSGAEANRWACEQEGGEFVADDILAPLDTTDFTPYIEQVLETDAEAWLVVWAGGGFTPLFQAAVDLGLTEEKALGSPFVDNVTMPIFFANAIGSTSSILYHYSLPDNEVNDWMVEQANARYDGAFPDLFDADGFNAALAVVGGFTETSGDTSAAAVIEALEGLEFDGPKGTIYIRPEDHVAIQDMYVATLLGFDSPTFEYYEYVETVRPEPPCLLVGDYADRCGDIPAP